MTDTPTTRSVAARVHEFIVETLLLGQDADFGPDDQLLEEGIIDSLGLLEIVTFIETDFDVTVDDADVTLDAFGSVNLMADYIETLLSAD